MIYINNADRTYNWVGHSKRKELYINTLFEKKQIIEDLEVVLTEELKESSNTNNLVVA